ncbi:MAG: FAD:protein FMN transferase [Marmoricola sp.]
MAAERRWGTWGTYVHLAVADEACLDEAHRIADAVLNAVGRACSRFRDDSELVRVNRSPGRWVRVDPLLVTALDVALAAARDPHRGGCLVGPCLGRTLVSLGYDADLAVVRRRAASVHAVPPSAPTDAWRQVRTGPGQVRIPDGSALDLGSTAKAWASDLVAASIGDALGTDALVSLGGDIAITGSGTAWPVAISEMPGATPEQTVSLDGGGLATSSVRVRRWSSAGTERHHLVDPRTGLPTTGPWRTVTATGPTCVAANLASTAAVVLGHDAVPWLTARGVDARLVAGDGSVTTVGVWPAAEEEVAA